MQAIPWDVVLTLLGVLVPVVAALYEFVLVGRKRLGYRIQMDTPAFDGRYGEPSVLVRRPSLVLVRIENNGSTNIDESDYAVAGDDPVGLRVRFPERRVVRAYTSEVSDPGLEHATPIPELNALPAEGATDERGNGLLKLPKVPLNRAQYYKVLVLLDETELGVERRPSSGQRPEPVIEGAIKGGSVQHTKSRTGVSRGSVGIIASLVAIILALGYVADTTEGQGPPIDCATGRLTLVGSTAFEPTLREATRAYTRTCPGAAFTVETSGSSEGLRQLDSAGDAAESGHPDVLAFTDGRKADGQPQLLPRPVAFTLFTLVVHRDAEVQDLTREQLRKIYRGEIRNWSEVGGADLAVRLVGRYSNSGTRRVLENRVLDGAPEPHLTSDDCRTRRPRTEGPALRCERGSTSDVLDTVVRTPGALGYSALPAAARRTDALHLVRIDGERPDVEAADRGAYPYWDTEYAYTYGEPPAHSLAAGFLRYLTHQVGRDVIRAGGHRPCAELRNPQLCRPEPTPPPGG
ncbi:PstS family phosphate ABC transporter substrate-binding protein [Streptomyces chumphonensis]|uniref:PstS family phosphate ABC transporter substrate-binding protein n=1 Tax=Streptomyces chumphonensis TaxID=1214925 RepID=UPI003D74508F